MTEAHRPMMQRMVTSEREVSQLPRVMLAGAEVKLPNVFTEGCLERLNGLFELLPGVVHEQSLKDGSVAASLARADYLLGTWGVPRLDDSFLRAAPRLKGLFYAAGSVKYFVTPEVFERGIIIASAWRANALPVAEFALGAILLGLKRVFPYARHLREHRKWEQTLKVAGAYKSTVGLLSLGAIGRRVAELLRQFEVRVISYDPHVSAEAMRAIGVRFVGLEELFGTSDVLSVHTPWLPETEGLVDARLLSMLKNGATFINTSRGAVVNEADFIEVMTKRPDVTAMLDVTYPEPPVASSPLWELPNVILTPHIAGSMGPEIARLGEWMVDELLRHIEGKPLLHQVSEEMIPRMA